MDCEPRHKKQKSVDLSSQATRVVDNAASEIIRQVDETHKKRMVELTQKQNMEVLEYFRTKNGKKESLDRRYMLERGVVCDQWGESEAKVEKLKQLDEDFKMRCEEFRREMDKCWKDMKAGHLFARTNEEEMRLKKIDVIRSAINRLEDGEIFEGVFDEMENVEGSYLYADADVTTKADAPSTSISSGNPNALRLESESGINALEDGERYTPPTVISRPVSPIQDSSHGERLNMANELAEISPDDSPKEDLIAMPVDPGEQIDKFTAPVILGPDDSLKEDLIAVRVNPAEKIDKYTAPVILGEHVILSSSSDTDVALEDAENQVSEGSISSSAMITDSQFVREIGQATCDDFVIVGSDDKQIYVKPMPVPVDETAFRVSSKQLDGLSIPVTPDNQNTSDYSLPLLKSSLGTRDHVNSTQSSEELPVPSDTIHENSSKENTVICLDSDDEQIMPEISVELPVNELEDMNDLLEEDPGISSEQPNHCSAANFENDFESFCSTKENQHQESQRMLGGGLHHRHSSLCEPLNGGVQISMNQDTTVGELSQRTQGNASSEMHRLFSETLQQFIDQSRQFPLEQPLPTQLPSLEIRVTDESIPSSSHQYAIENHLMHPMTRAAEINTSDYNLNHSSDSYVPRTDSCQRSSFNPLQIELAKMIRAGCEEKKNYEDMVLQLKFAREKEIAQVWQKYSLLSQQAENDARQKRKELGLCYEKTRAHLLLAKAWNMEIDESSPIFLPSTPLHSTSMHTTNALARMVNQFSGTPSTNDIPRPHHPLSYHNPRNPEVGRGSCNPNPHIHKLRSNHNSLTFSPSGSAAGYYANLYS